MDRDKYIRYTEKCIDCNKCKNSCSFLEKYGITLKDIDKLSDLAYHCFLCGKCTEVCPVNIDGKNMILEMRRDKLAEDKKVLDDLSYKTLIFEKNDYIFKNYKRAKKIVLFPGCNYVSLYPKTCKKILDELNKYEEMGIIYDCCGKPISELGMQKEEKNIVNNIEYKIKSMGIEEIVTMCPNCYYYLKDRLSIDVKTIYEKCSELGVEVNTNFDIDKMYIPCPDRVDKIFLNQIQSMIGKVDILDDIQCCGLGGLGIVKENELAKNYGKSFNNVESDYIYTYCASCTGKFNRDGQKDTYHILSALFSTFEKADIKKSFVNRMMKSIVP